MGKTCEPKAFSFQCMTKFTTNKKNKNKNKNKKNATAKRMGKMSIRMLIMSILLRRISIPDYKGLSFTELSGSATLNKPCS